MRIVALTAILGSGILLFRIQRPEPPALETTGPVEQSPQSSSIGTTTAADPQSQPVAATQPGIDVPEPAAFPADKDLPPDFLDRIVAGNSVAFTLPDGRKVAGGVEMIQRDSHGVIFVQGRIALPAPGFYFFQRQTTPGIAGPFVGHVRFDGTDDAWKIEPNGNLGAARFNSRKLDEILCVNYAEIPEAPEAAEADVENSPQTHPYPIPIPSYQTIVPLQSLPGATAVIYLDFDGEKGPFPGWGTFDAAPASANNDQVFDVWKMVCEDFQGFNINVTTDRKVFDSAPEGRRSHCIISPTTTASPGAGGVAYVGSFNWSGDRVCWSFYSTGKSSCEVVAHEIGHTLGLSHDGRTSPSEGYYGGHGTDPTGWAPIMGVGYYKKLSQWSKGEYLSANQTQDDLSIITNNNNDVDYRTDDAGDLPASARYLEIASNNSVFNEGIIEKTGDVDSFRFVTTGGQATINVNTVTLNPDLDILAEIVDAATTTVVASDNPDLGINAAVSSLLPAGEYLLRIRGTGRGDPLGDGYTDYGCTGSYLITGSVAGGIKPESFTIAENSANGSEVGTIVPRNDHVGAPLVFAIASGNTNGVFSIDPLTGAITVANSAALDFEALSLRWDDPATLELFVTITDSSTPSLNEILRTVVTIANLNESPALTGGALTILEHTYAGTNVFKAASTDPDRFDFGTYSITAGNTGDVFSINSGTGQITVDSDIDVAADTVFNLTVIATDQGSPSLATSANVAITVVNTVDGYIPGRITRTYYEGISGGTVANLTGNAKFPDNPDSQEFLTSFDGQSHGDTFGSTIRGYVIPPATGTYQFWIASDDASELRLGSSAAQDSATVRATVSGYTNPYAWTANTAQQSSPVNLTAGQAYYIEARHKEGSGGDHVAVAWSGPGITRQVISGLYLAPFYQNYAPKVNSAAYAIRESAMAGQPVGEVTSIDVNIQDSFSGYTITGGNTGEVFAIDPATGQLSVALSGMLDAATTPSYTLTIRTTDNGIPALNGSGTVTVNVTQAAGINVTGIAQEIWTSIAGTALTGLTGSTNYPHRPNVRRSLSSFSSGENYAENYGSRIRAKFVPPVSGDYRFYIAGDDECRLLFSTSENGSGAAQIASISGWTNAGEWTKFTSQTSVVKTLVAGQPVYLEALHKEGGGGDHVSVGYTGPDTAAVTVIPGSMLLPFDINVPPVFSPASYSYTVNGSTAATGTPLGTVSATESNGETIVYTILSGNSAGAFAIHSGTGAITIADPAALSAGPTTLQVAAQDGGLSGIYPLASSTATVAVNVTNLNRAPAFVSDPLAKPDATEGLTYAETLAGSTSDSNAGDPLTFTRISGPAWLSVASNGSLSGTPAEADIGSNSFVVRVTDSGGLFAETTLNISVTGVNEAPVFTTDVVNASTLKDSLFSTSITATDPDTGDTRTFSKVSGPEWLNVAANGNLSGTPLAGNTGLNAFILRVTDAGGLFDESTLNVEVIASPTWTNSAGGSWPTSVNWLGGIIGSGTDRAIDFSTLDLTANATVTLNGERTVGHMIFADTTASHNWTLDQGTAGSLTLDVSTGVPSITVTNQAATINLPIAGFKGLVKAGSGAMNLTAANGYTGNTTVSNGSLIVTGSLDNTSATIATGASLAGTGIIGGTVQNHGTLSPGNDGPGNLTIRNTLTLGPDSTVDWQVVDWTGSAGIGHDVLTASALDITATTTNQVTIRISGLTPDHFSETGKSFTLIADSGTITGFDPAKFVLDTTGFTAGSGTWAIRQTGTNIELLYTRPNSPPDFTTDPILLAATQDQTVTGNIVATDPDSGEMLSYSKISGPAWLTVSGTGVLGGVPTNADVGLNTFTVRVTDSGNLFSESTLEITVANVNDAPVFTIPAVTGTGATQDVPYTATLAGSAADPDTGDAPVFSKISGPAWLAVAPTGDLTGTPANGDVGPNSFTVRITDGGSLFSESTLEITVANVNDAPVFTIPAITGTGATQDVPYTATLVGSATDPDTGDVPTFSKVSGPAWLAVAPNGDLTGTPANGDAGPNSFTVRVTDSGGLFAEATLQIQVTAINPDRNDNGILDTWEIEKFGNADPDNHPADADADQDGLSNLMEFALGTHPAQANASPLVTGFATDGPETFLQLTVPKNPSATNLAYVVEVSANIFGAESWSATPTVVVSDTATELIVRDAVSVQSSQSRFIRLKVHTLP